MRKSKKITIIVSAVVAAVGLCLCIGGWIAMDFKFSNLNSENYETKTYSVENTFAHINVEADEYDVRLYPAEDGQCKVVYAENEKVSCSVKVENDTLSIKIASDRKWYESIGFGFHWSQIKLDIYLPEKQYESLVITSRSGDTTVPEGFRFGKAEVCSASGEVAFLAAVEDDLSIKTESGDVSMGMTNPKVLHIEAVSGDVAVNSANVTAELSVKTVSGDMELKNIACGNAAAKSTSGEILFVNVTAEEQMAVKTNSGDIELQQCDADTLDIKSTSGDVFGILLTEKIFMVETVSGDIDAPRSATGGLCKVKTTSGNIKFKFAES